MLDLNSLLRVYSAPTKFRALQATWENIQWHTPWVKHKGWRGGGEERGNVGKGEP